jgi:hypothetical protein
MLLIRFNELGAFIKPVLTGFYTLLALEFIPGR